MSSVVCRLSPSLKRVEICVHNRIYNSVADYNSSRVGVGCMYKCPSSIFTVGLFFGIIFQRYKLKGSHFLWLIIMFIYFKNKPIEFFLSESMFICQPVGEESWRGKTKAILEWTLAFKIFMGLSHDLTSEIFLNDKI